MARVIPLHTDPPLRTARAARLHYVRSTARGIKRLGSPGRFTYKLDGRRVTAKATLERIAELVIPPAWTDVWICTDPHGHLQATGRDARGRKQYRYHPRWSEVRNATKYAHTLAFGMQLPTMRKRLAKDLARKGLPLEKVLATVVSVMERTHIRVGHDAYARANGSHGLSTLKDRHVKTERGGLRFVFKGKTGVMHDIRLGSKRLARLVMRCKELPGQDLFQYLDASGTARPITSEMVNAYIRSITGGEFTSKDIRTWKGTVHCAAALLGQALDGTDAARAQAINAALDTVAAALGNTRTVARKYYVHPAVIAAYEAGRLDEMASGARSTVYLSREERLVLAVLKNHGKGQRQAMLRHSA